jgi:DNA-binding beta-propeller fold protein YncE
MFAGILAAVVAPASTVSLPGGDDGIGFDDLRFDAKLGAVLVPAGRTGNLALVDPRTGAVTAIGGFARTAPGRGGHAQGVTSVDAGEGWLFATDRTTRTVAVIDPRNKKIVAHAPLAGGPDYVRYVAATRELWVTEPDDERIEIFSLSKARPPAPTHAAFIPVRGGPESLVIDGRRGRAYAHQWKRETVAIDVKTRKLAATWASGCDAPRGIALDEARGFLLVGCAGGEATALEVARQGKVLSKVDTGGSVDIIAYDPGRRRLYLPGSNTARMAIVDVSTEGKLSLLGTVPTVPGSHCATTDGAGKVYVCDPGRGRLLVIPDPY